MRTPSAAVKLDRTNFPEFRDAILSYTAASAPPLAARSYPGYRKVALQKVRARLWAGLDGNLRKRRCARALHSSLPSAGALARLLRFSHGICADSARGPVPSAGGLQALEVYLAVLSAGWLEAGVYHYDRTAHALAQIACGGSRADWDQRVPSLSVVSGGALLWIIAGDYRRVSKKYGPRAQHFLALEAGHLMQNLCLLSTSLGLCTLPLGGYFEDEVAAALRLPRGDEVLYLGLCGKGA